MVGPYSKLALGQLIFPYQYWTPVSQCHVSEEMKGGGPYSICAYNDFMASKQDVLVRDFEAPNAQGAYNQLYSSMSDKEQDKSRI